MNNKQYLDAFRNYYKLKRDYDNKLNLKKKKIKKMDISTQEKKERIKRFIKQRPCIICKKKGGTLFTNNLNILKAVCGNENPCDLHIEIKKPQYHDLQDNLDILEEKLYKIKQEITSLKLDLLFELQGEDIILNEFDTLKDSLQQTLNEKKAFQDIFDNKNKFIEAKIDDSAEFTKINIVDLINLLQKDYNNIVYKFRVQIKQYIKENNSNFLNDIIQIYKDKLIPLQNRLRELKYQEIYINEYKQTGGKKGVKLMPVYHLILNKYKKTNRIVSDDSFEIISNKK